jgi:hypothetical protein
MIARKSQSFQNSGKSVSIAVSRRRLGKFSAKSRALLS